MATAFKVALGITVAAGVAAVAFAQSPPADRSIKFRQGVLNAQGWNMGVMGAMVKGDRPYNKEEFLLRATNLEKLSTMPWEGFGPGTDTGAPTKAKPEIWKDSAKFKQLQDKYIADVPKLVAAAQTGNLDAIKGPFGEVGKDCTACHDEFRAK
jgi:cytochrome c556